MPRTSAQDRTQVLPFPQATDLHLRIARSFSMITDWNAALVGHFPLADVLAILTKQTKARNIALFRLVNDKACQIATCTCTYDDLKPELSSGNVARYLRDHYAANLTPGSIWRLAELMKDEAFAETPAAREWAARPDICEVSLIVLDVDGAKIDFLEMIFDSPPDPSPDLPVSIITQALAYSWAVRTPGLVTRLIRTYGRNRSRSQPENLVSILGAQNPCGLSRAELRVAQLLVTGTKAREIADALGVSVPTVRTHLRNLYAKTETSGQGELIALITASDGSF